MAKLIYKNGYWVAVTNVNSSVAPQYSTVSQDAEEVKDSDATSVANTLTTNTGNQHYVTSNELKSVPGSPTPPPPGS